MTSLAASGFGDALPAAQRAAGAQHYPEAALYMVATPIGNLADITLRALHVLQAVDLLACEDTRHTQALLRAYGIERPAGSLIAVHQHNEAEAARAVLARLAAGARVGYVSDAGTPGVSDPGARLAAAAAGAGHRVLPIPGCSSITALVSAAALVEAAGPATGGFVFEGFAPARAAERAQAVERWRAEPRAVVLLESPHRIEALAQALAPLGDRPVTIGRELTKQFEQLVTLPAQALADWLAGDRDRARGEFSLVLHPQPPTDGEAAREGERVLRLLLAELPLKTAVRLAADISGAPRNALYEQALRLRDAPGA